jgi:hypothetical protein
VAAASAPRLAWLNVAVSGGSSGGGSIRKCFPASRSLRPQVWPSATMSPASSPAARPVSQMLTKPGPAASARRTPGCLPSLAAMARASSPAGSPVSWASRSATGEA